MPPFVLDILGAIVRTLLASMLNPLWHWLANHGYVVAPTEISQVVTWLVGVVAICAWSIYKHYGARLRQYVAQEMPQGTTEDEVKAAIKTSKLIGQPLPSVLSPSNLPASAGIPAVEDPLVKGQGWPFPVALPPPSVPPPSAPIAGPRVPPAAMFVLAAGLLCGASSFMTAGCAPVPPAGTYTAPVSREYQAAPLQQAILALSKTAIQMNATAGSTHLADADTALVRDFALTTSGAVDQWVRGVGTLTTVRATLTALTNRLSDQARLRSLNQVLGAVSLALTNLGGV